MLVKTRINKIITYTSKKIKKNKELKVTREKSGFSPSVHYRYAFISAAT